MFKVRHYLCQVYTTGDSWFEMFVLTLKSVSMDWFDNNNGKRFEDVRLNYRVTNMSSQTKSSWEQLLGTGCSNSHQLSSFSVVTSKSTKIELGLVTGEKFNWTLHTMQEYEQKFKISSLCRIFLQEEPF